MKKLTAKPDRLLAKKMPELFPDFVSSRESFERAKAFWGQLATDEASALGQVGEWTTWFQLLKWEDDREMMDGAVVFSLYSASQNKGLRVQQSLRCISKKEEPYGASFTDVFGEGHLARLSRICSLVRFPQTEISRFSGESSLAGSIETLIQNS